MGQLITNARFRSEPPEEPSQYARMIPGISAVPSRWPPRKPPRPSYKSTEASGKECDSSTRAHTIAQVLLPHPIAEPFPLYLAVAADFLVLAAVCSAEIFFMRVWSLNPFDIPPFAVLVTLFAFTEGIYSKDVLAPAQEVLPGLARSILFAITIVFFTEHGRIRAPALLVTNGGSLAALLLYREMRRLARLRWGSLSGCRNVLIIGGGPVFRSIARTLSNDPLHHTFVRGCLDDDLPLSATVLGRVADLDWLARAEFIDEVILALPGRPEEAREAADVAYRNHLDIRAVPDLPSGYWPEAGIDLIGDVPVVTLHREPVPSAALFLKRSLDIVGAALALLLAAPVMAAVALLIRRDSPGPIIYAAERTGMKGRLFRCYKFRTMVADADTLKADLQSRNQRQGPIFKIVDDPRITRVGRFLRRYSLDELPQLWNVLCGEMSLVGPRPHPVEEVNHYELHHYRRLDMKPGITGLWQITARHSPSFELNMHLDLTYIETWTLRLDLRILLGTLHVLFRPEGT
jgi:exopolysaccharide biosynthesis polyprenyl glycosylphosphotransferase